MRIPVPDGLSGRKERWEANLGGSRQLFILFGAVNQCLIVIMGGLSSEWMGF